MFTGIVEEIGTIAHIQRGQYSARLTIRATKVLEDAKLGDSIAVNGICLTVTSVDAGTFQADVMHETLNRSTLAKLKQGSCVNLERAMSANGRLGGHIVSGHVDGMGRIVEIRQDDTAIWYTIQTETAIMRYIIEKGSVAIDGISLTVARVEADRFSVSAIPHTVQETILKERREGDCVNLENDMIGKYIEKLLQPVTETPTQGRITMDFLNRHGY